MGRLDLTFLVCPQKCLDWGVLQKDLHKLRYLPVQFSCVADYQYLIIIDRGVDIHYGWDDESSSFSTTIARLKNEIFFLALVHYFWDC